MAGIRVRRLSQSRSTTSPQNRDSTFSTRAVACCWKTPLLPKLRRSYRADNRLYSYTIERHFRKRSLSFLCFCAPKEYIVSKFFLSLQRKGAERDLNITIGEKGIRWKSETMPVAVSPVLAASYNRNRSTKKDECWSYSLPLIFKIGKARQRTSQKTCLRIMNLLPAGIWVVIMQILLLKFL